jgi:hypothetical protein
MNRSNRPVSRWGNHLLAKNFEPTKAQGYSPNSYPQRRNEMDKNDADRPALATLRKSN